MDRLRSETMVVAAPMSFTGSARRLTNLLWHRRQAVYRRWAGWWLLPAVVVAAWVVVGLWYAFWFGLFGWWVLPYRFIRRAQRTNKVLEQRHRELLGALGAQHTAPGASVPEPGPAHPAAAGNRDTYAPAQLPAPQLRRRAETLPQLGPGRPPGPRF